MSKNLEEILDAALRSGVAHNNGTGGQYLLCATEQQLTRFAYLLTEPAQAGRPDVLLEIVMPCGCVAKFGAKDHRSTPQREGHLKHIAAMLQIYMDALITRQHRCELVSDDNPYGWKPISRLPAFTGAESL